ncbi:CCA tRNA nucleotidyltransferase [Phascolarctobacterium sp.]|uniref:CCA tRNA nucleotidyltransferase n=1 Tax=Phascolarctobacterium sp. TaxID=2049039 RepID=UPI00257E7778|nr:CCA tRNA nucleotidyltransferase [Phascolarctobacterium sp.]
MTAENRRFLLPPIINRILTLLTEQGFAAYVVGGAVRDLLLGKAPGDFDVATSARPESVISILEPAGFTVVGELGQNFGVVVVHRDSQTVEIATFRGEVYGGDAHKPEQVWYCDDLEADLSRRDFTVNAMALDQSGNVYDYHGGRQDLQQKILRTVGDAPARYQEDALRMYRACRFVGQLGFDYVQRQGAGPAFGQPQTPYYLPQSYSFPVSRSAGLSLERVRTELDKLLLGKWAGKGLMLMMATGLAAGRCRVREQGTYREIAVLPELEHLAGLPQNQRFHCYDVWEHTLAAVDNSPRQLAIRWALLLHDVAKGLPGIRRLNKEGQPSDHGHEAESAVMAEVILSRLRYPAPFVQRVVWLVSRHMRFAPMLVTGERTLLRWLRSEAAGGNFKDSHEMTAAFEQLVAVFLADMGATHAGKNTELMAEGRALGTAVLELSRSKMPVHTKDLAISGHDVLVLLEDKSKIRDAMRYLLQRVQSTNLPNERSALEEAVRGWQKRH